MNAIVGSVQQPKRYPTDVLGMTGRRDTPDVLKSKVDNMTQNDITTVDRETLIQLREFADRHANEYGDLEVAHAIIDSGVALGLDDPTPRTEPERMDLEGLLSWPKYDESDIEGYVQKYRDHS